MSQVPDTEGRPLCKCHGEPMYRDGKRGGRQRWDCRVRRVKRDRVRYHTNPKYREYHKAKERERYRSNPEYKKAYNRERQVTFSVGGFRWAVYVDNKEEVLAAKAAFRAEQKREYKEAADGGFHQTIA